MSENNKYDGVKESGENLKNLYKRKWRYEEPEQSTKVQENLGDTYLDRFYENERKENIINRYDKEVEANDQTEAAEAAEEAELAAEEAELAAKKAISEAIRAKKTAKVAKNAAEEAKKVAKLARRKEAKKAKKVAEEAGIVQEETKKAEEEAVKAAEEAIKAAEEAKTAKEYAIIAAEATKKESDENKRRESKEEAIKAAEEAKEAAEKAKKAAEEAKKANKSNSNDKRSTFITTLKTIGAVAGVAGVAGAAILSGNTIEPSNDWITYQEAIQAGMTPEQLGINEKAQLDFEELKKIEGFKDQKHVYKTLLTLNEAFKEVLTGKIEYAMGDGTYKVEYGYGYEEGNKYNYLNINTGYKNTTYYDETILNYLTGTPTFSNEISGAINDINEIGGYIVDGPDDLQETILFCEKESKHLNKFAALQIEYDGKNFNAKPITRADLAKIEEKNIGRNPNGGMQDASNNENEQKDDIAGDVQNVNYDDDGR